MKLKEIRCNVGITQDVLAQRMRERGRGTNQGDIMKIENSYNSPTISRLRDYVESLGMTLEISAKNDQGSYLLDLDDLTRSRTKDARKK